MPEIASWDAYNEAVWPEQVGDPLSPVTMSLRHPSYPFEAEWAGNDPQELRGIVATYLSKVRERLGLPKLSPRAPISKYSWPGSSCPRPTTTAWIRANRSG